MSSGTDDGQELCWLRARSSLHGGHCNARLHHNSLRDLASQNIRRVNTSSLHLKGGKKQEEDASYATNQFCWPEGRRDVLTGGRSYDVPQGESITLYSYNSESPPPTTLTRFSEICVTDSNRGPHCHVTACQGVTSSKSFPSLHNHIAISRHHSNQLLVLSRSMRGCDSS
jgi:hypothetical protein